MKQTLIRYRTRPEKTDENERLILRVPVDKAPKSGMRKLSSREKIQSALDARIPRHGASVALVRETAVARPGPGLLDLHARPADPRELVVDVMAAPIRSPALALTLDLGGPLPADGATAVQRDLHGAGSHVAANLLVQLVVRRLTGDDIEVTCHAHSAEVRVDVPVNRAPAPVTQRIGGRRRE